MDEANKPHKHYKKTMLAIAMMDNGADARTALQAVNNTENPGRSTIELLKSKYRQFTLTAPKTVRLAESQIKRILRARSREAVKEKITDASGEVSERIEYIHPTDSNILAAAAMVYDRYEPVKSQDTGAGQGNTYIDLSGYTNNQIVVQVEEKQGVIDVQPVDT